LYKYSIILPDMDPVPPGPSSFVQADRTATMNISTIPAVRPLCGFEMIL